MNNKREVFEKMPVPKALATLAIPTIISQALTLIAMKGYSLDGNRIKTIQAVNAARKAAVENGMSMDEAMLTITDETV